MSSVEGVQIKWTFGFWLKRMAIRFSVFRWLALLIAPHVDSGRRRYLGATEVVVLVEITEVSFEQKVSAATYIVAHGADGAGIATWATLMSPVKKFTLDEVDREASRLLGRVQLALLAEVPQQVKTQILQDQAEHLSSE